MSAFVSIEAEASVIGSVLLDSTVYPLIDIEPHHFSQAWAKEAWAEIQSRAGLGQPTDLVVIGEVLPQHAHSLATACETTAATTNAPAYADIVRDRWTKRQSYLIGQSLMDTQDTDAAIRELIGLTSQGDDRWDVNPDEMARVAAKILTGRAEAGLPTGFKVWDDKLGGLKRGELVVVAARPAMGKTAFCMGMAERFGKPVLVMSGEMDRTPIVQRLLSSLAKVPLLKIIQQRLSHDEEFRLAEAVKTLRTMGLHMNDKSEPSLSDVTRAARKAYHQHGISCVIVDYLQRMKTSGDRRHEAVGENARGLKTLARELNIPVIALAQVKRDVENRPLVNRQPMMSDISDSSEIEKEADVIATLFRVRGYKSECSPEQREDHTASIVIVKNRNGPTGKMNAVFREEFAKFEDMA